MKVNVPAVGAYAVETSWLRLGVVEVPVVSPAAVSPAAVSLAVVVSPVVAVLVEASEAVGVQVSGRYPSWVRICCNPSVEYEPVVNETVDAVLSVPAEVAASVMSAGIVSLTLVSGRNPDAGVNVAVAPLTFQLPAILGESVGNGVVADSGEEKVSVTGPPPLAW